MKDISIIVPTLNRAPLLAKMLNSVTRTVGPSDAVEIMIVDNGSVDETSVVSREITRKFPRYEWRYLYEPMPGLLSARHRGAEAAAGEILSFVDDDVLLSTTWLGALSEAFSNQDIALVGGPSLPLFVDAPPKWLNNLWEEDEGRRVLTALSLFESGPTIKAEDPLYVWGLNFSIRNAVFKACGGFHPDIVPASLRRYQGDGDTGLSLKVREAGLRALTTQG